MTSRALDKWKRDRSRELDELVDAHRAIGGSGRGRRYATAQVNHAYAVLLSSQFQGFCRDLHSECVDHLVAATQPVALQAVLRLEFLFNRKLDQHNPNPGNIGSDFSRLGLPFWDRVYAVDPRGLSRNKSLEALNHWRNAIAHQDFTGPELGGRTALGLAEVQAFRRSCEGAAVTFDRVMRTHLAAVVGAVPW